MTSTMSKEERTSLQSDLAAALAAGKSCAEWASANGVSERTAQRWASEPEVRAEIETHRRGNLDQAVSRMSLRVSWATDEIANSQKVLLAAAVAEGTAVAKWASTNEVPERTAYRWAAEPEVRFIYEAGFAAGGVVGIDLGANPRMTRQGACSST